MTFPIDFGYHSFGRKIFIPVSLMPAGSYLPPPQQIKKNCGCQIIYFFRSYSDYVREEQEQEHRLDGVLLEPGPQVRQEQPHCREEPLDAHLCHWDRSERNATGPHRSGVGWDDLPHISFCKNFNRKWEGQQWRIQREGFGRSRISKRYPNF